MGRREADRYEDARIAAAVARILESEALLPADVRQHPRKSERLRKAFAQQAASLRKRTTRVLVEPHERAAQRYAEAAEILESARVAAQRAGIEARFVAKLTTAARAYAESADAETRAADANRVRAAELLADPGPGPRADSA